jgi:hypothetical protein
VVVVDLPGNDPRWLEVVYPIVNSDTGK